MLTKAKLYLRTLPHLRTWQIVGRLIAPIRSRLPQRLSVPENLSGQLEAQIPFLQHEPWNSREEILEGRYTFLNQTEDLGRQVDWEAQHMPLLWRFNLHYFHYLHLLNPDEQSQLCRSWMDANPSPGGASWHPYPTSHRIVNWIKSRVEGRRLDGSLYRQAAYLRRNLETYVYGNHLIENARALVFAGRYFGDQGEAPEWLEKGLRILRGEADRQILPDGGHYERSPMYHALMVEVYADVLNILDGSDPSIAWLQALLQRMTVALNAMTHPDGRIALFNDSTLEISPPSTALQAYVSDLGVNPSPYKECLPDSGYHVHDSAELYIIIDSGPGGPGHLMAHAHADIFSYELSIGGKRFVVDTGVYQYTAGEERQIARSTRAHNTVCIDGVDQIECWGSFRVARRAAPHHVSTRRDDQVASFEGAFGGYAEMIGDGIEHLRRIHVEEGKRTISVRDEVTGVGRHLVESRIHLHPEVERGANGTLRRGNVTSRIKADEIRWERAPYYPRFGVREERWVVVIGGERTLPTSLEYAISY